MDNRPKKSSSSQARWSVLHLINVFDARYDRDQRRIVDLQRQRGYDVSVITSRYDDELKHRNPLFFQQAEAPLTGVKISHNYSCKFSLGNAQPSVFYLPDATSLRAYDVTHVHGLTSYSNLLGCLLKRLNQSKLVTRSDLSQPGYQLLKNSVAYRSFFFKLLKSMDAIYTYTASEKAVLLDLGIPEDLVWVVPLGIQLERFFESAAADKSRSTITIGFIGRFDRVKGVHRLVKPLGQILREHKNVRVKFAGPKQDAKYATSILREMSLLPSFSYVGSLASSETPWFYQECDIVLVPSLSDTGGIVALEAMASGNAIVASNIPPFTEYFRDGVSGLLVDSEDEIYSSCKLLIEDDDLRVRLGCAARKNAGSYSDVAMVEKLEEIYIYIAGRLEPPVTDSETTR
jgi:glycosyltransferase involved in cell wall biosynthesis